MRDNMAKKNPFILLFLMRLLRCCCCCCWLLTTTTQFFLFFCTLLQLAKGKAPSLELEQREFANRKRRLIVEANNTQMTGRGPPSYRNNELAHFCAAAKGFKVVVRWLRSRTSNLLITWQNARD